MQLAAYGAQDVYLTGNPMITHFKVVYKRHTNFALQSIEHTFIGTVEWGSTVSATLARNGDLVNGITIQATLPNIRQKYISGSIPGGATSQDLQLQELVLLRWIDNIGHYLIEHASIEIGGQEIDRHWSDWLEIWAQLTVPASKEAGYRAMIGQDPKGAFGQPSGLQKDVFTSGGGTDNIPYIKGKIIYIPMQFWFCRNPGLALPLIALQYHPVKFTVKFRALDDMLVVTMGQPGTAPGLGTDYISAGSIMLSDVPKLAASLWVDYVFLDTDERRRFSQVSHEYLIEQLQFSQHETEPGKTEAGFRLDLNQPVKELLWIIQDPEASTLRREWGNWTTCVTERDTRYGLAPSSTGILGLGQVADSTTNNAWTWHIDPANGLENITTLNYLATLNRSCTNPIRANGTKGENWCSRAQLILNNTPRFESRESDYFNLVQPHYHHKCIPKSPGLNMYSFSFKPEEHQPSGSCNFSRIDNSVLILDIKNVTALTHGALPSLLHVKIYAVNYNILRIMGGMGGVAYTS